MTLTEFNGQMSIEDGGHLFIIPSYANQKMALTYGHSLSPQFMCVSNKHKDILILYVNVIYIY